MSHVYYKIVGAYYYTDKGGQVRSVVAIGPGLYANVNTDFTELPHRRPTLVHMQLVPRTAAMDSSTRAAGEFGTRTTCPLYCLANHGNVCSQDFNSKCKPPVQSWILFGALGPSRSNNCANIPADDSHFVVMFRLARNFQLRRMAGFLVLFTQMTEKYVGNATVLSSVLRKVS